MRTIGVGPSYDALEADIAISALTELPEHAFQSLIANSPIR